MFKNRKCVNHNTYDYIIGEKGEITTQKSMTIQDHAMSLETLLERHRTGQNVKVFEPVYNESDIPDTKKLTKIEKIEMARELKDYTSKTNKEIHDRIKERQKERREKAKAEALAKSKKKNDEKFGNDKKDTDIAV